jgi:hypothetical protein
MKTDKTYMEKILTQKGENFTSDNLQLRIFNLDRKKKFNWFQALKLMNNLDSLIENLEAKDTNHSDRLRLLRSRYSSDLKQLAASWVTCACGNQCSIIPRSMSGMPSDIKLQKLGQKFFNLVETWRWSDALNTLEEIEVWSAQLIEKIRAKKAK